MSPRGFFVRYGSRRALDADHAAYLMHGGILLPITPEVSVPPQAAVEVRIEGPDGLTFVLSGRVGRRVAGRGLMIAFDERSRVTRQALDDLIESPTFRSALDREPVDGIVAPVVGTYDVAGAGPIVPRSIERPEPKPAPPTARPIEQDIESVTDPAISAPHELLGMFDETTPVDPRPPVPVDNHPPLGAEPAPTTDAPQEGADLHPDVAAAARRRRPAPTAERPPTVIREARGGEIYHVAVVKLYTVQSYLETFPRFFTDAELEVPYSESGLSRGQVVLLRLTLPGHNVFEMWAVVEHGDLRRFVLRVRDNDEAYRKAILYPESVAAKGRRQREAAGEAEDTPWQVILLEEKKVDSGDSKMPLRRRLARMGMDDKINLALSGNREERMAIAMDSNKAVHHYLLKNAKLSLDEIAFMARLPSLNPDVLDKIAENPAYTQNPTVTKALVFNPRTPVRTAIRLLDRLPRTELMNLSKRMSMNQRLVMAAKNKLMKVK